MRVHICLILFLPITVCEKFGRTILTPHVWISVGVRACACVCMSMRICVYVCIRLCTCLCMHVSTWYACMHICVYVPTFFGV